MSIIATAVKHLLVAGVTGDALVMAIEDMERAMPQQEVRSKAAIRQANYRERKASQAITNHNETLQSETLQSVTSVTPPPSLSPPNDNNLTPPIPTPVYKTTRARRLPVDWEPAPLPAQLGAQVSAWRCGMLESEMAKFRDWAASAHGKVALKRDWDAAWRNWLRRNIEEGPKNGQSRNEQSRMGVTERAARQAMHEIDGGIGRFDDCREEISPSDRSGNRRTIDAVPYAVRAIGYAGR